jgi:hypothetical protein
MGADATAFAIIQVRRKKALGCLVDAGFGAEYVTDSAFDTFLVIPDGTLGPPASRFIRTGVSRLEHDTTGGDFLPSFRPFLLFHGNTSIIILLHHFDFIVGPLQGIFILKGDAAKPLLDGGI